MVFALMLNFVTLEHSRVRRALEESLGEAEFAEAWAAGQAMTMDQAMAYAPEALKPAEPSDGLAGGLSRPVQRAGLRKNPFISGQICR